jgi:hypothetical protein
MLLTQQHEILCNDLNFVLDTSVATHFSFSGQSTVLFNYFHSCHNTKVYIVSYKFD